MTPALTCCHPGSLTLWRELRHTGDEEEKKLIIIWLGSPSAGQRVECQEPRSLLLNLTQAFTQAMWSQPFGSDPHKGV